MELPQTVKQVLDNFVNDVSETFGPRLKAIVLYGSAAEGRLRPTSDVNVVVVTTSFSAVDAHALGSLLAFCASAIDLHVMFILESELETASELFAVKFYDISKRRQLLYGIDPFASLHIPRAALVNRLRQVLLNQLLRLRYSFTQRNESADNLSAMLAESIPANRAAASAILELRGVQFSCPKEALASVALELREDGYKESLAIASNAREGGTIPLESLRKAIGDLLELTAKMKELVKTLPC